MNVGLTGIIIDALVFKAVGGIGMIFFGLETMSSGFKHPDVNNLLLQLFTTLSGDTMFGVVKCAAAGCLATMVVQSSSATLGITIAPAQSGIIEFHTAAALIRSRPTRTPTRASLYTPVAVEVPSPNPQEGVPVSEGLTAGHLQTHDHGDRTEEKTP